MKEDIEFMEQMLALLMRLEPGQYLHFEPFETEWRVRLSDGRKMIEHQSLTHQQGIRIGEFLLKGADIFERAMKLPAVGMLKLEVNERERHLQISSTPVVWGVKLVISVMQTHLAVLKLTDLGFEPAVLNRLQELIKQPHGLVIIGGRSRSGRSTTGRALLGEAAANHRRVTSIEYADQGKVPEVDQIVFDPDHGQSVVGVMKSLSTSAVDVVKTYLDGYDEMAESLRMAASRLVIGDMNAGGAIDVVCRFLVNNLPPHDLACRLQLVLVQRLLPRLCPECRVAKPASPAMLKNLGIDGAFLRRAGLPESPAERLCFYQHAGCATCNNSGYQGKQLVIEALNMNDEIRQLVQLPDFSRDDLEAAAARNGWNPFRAQALACALRGSIRVEDALLS